MANTGHCRLMMLASLLVVSSLAMVSSWKPAYGQTVNATLYGSVTDSTGAAIPGAHIIASEVQTGIRTKTITDVSGGYVFPSLSPGVYAITVEKTGFKASVLAGIQLLVDQKARLDVTLQVGEVSTRVEVVGATPLVETNTASVGTVIGEQDVVNLPLNLRRFGALATLVPGTTTDNGGFASNAQGSPFSETTYTANGARSSSNNILIDGADSKSLTFGGFALQPPPDAIQEFKIQTNIYSAAFGKTAGSTINLVTKSGTNGLHGSAYEFLRNDALDARNFFATDRPEYRRNQFGFTVGGPIRKNKTFIFGYYEALRQVQGSSLTSTIPTPDQLSGNFSDVLTGNTINLCGAGGPQNLNFDSGQLFYPASESLVTCPDGSANAGSTVLAGNPVPGNIVTSIDPVAQKALSLGAFPTPNRTGFPNFVNQQPLLRNDSQFGVRIDHNFGDKDQLFVRYLFGQANIFDYSNVYDFLPNFGDTIYYRGQNLAMAWPHTFGPHLLNEARFAFQRNYDVSPCQNCPYAPGFIKSFGIANLQALTPKDEGFPYFGFVNFSGTGDAGYVPTISPDMLEKYEDNLTWTHGRHTVVVGTDMQFWQVFRAEFPFQTHGQIYFNGQYSGLAGEMPDAGGVADVADFLLGYPDNAARTVRYTNTNQAGGGIWNWYAQDDFKISPNLALNIGLRYEYRRPPVDKGNNYVTFVPLGPKFSGPGNGVLVTAAADAVNDALCTDPSYSYLISSDGLCLVANSTERAQLGFTGRTRRTLMFPDKKDFAPRIGLTGRPSASDKFVMHAGYGIFYDLPNFNQLHFVTNNPVFSPTQIYNTSFGAPPPLTNGAPTTTEEVFAAGGTPPLSQQFASLYVSPNYRAPYVQEWSLGISSQLAQNWALDVSYIGNKGTRLGNLHLFANQPEPGVGSLQSRRPYPDFNIMLFTTPDANSTYNSLQVKLTKRFSSGFTFLTAYTFAHSIDDSEGDEGFTGGTGNKAPQDDNNLEANRGNAVNDARHRVAFSGVWQLPVGNGKRFLDRAGRINQVLGGWQASGVVSFQGGFPFTVQSGQDFSNTGSSNARPDRTCSGQGKKTVDSWFDTSCFTTAALATALASGQPRFGNSGRNILDGPGLNNWDLALLKNFRLSERFGLEFRSEFYNAFNFAHFGYPGAVVGAPTFGIITTAGQPRDIQFALKLSF